MTTLEDLFEVERDAVNPTDDDLKRASRAVALAVGLGVATTSLGAAASGASATSSKFAAFFGTKAVLGWSVAAAVGVGVAAATVAPLPWAGSTKTEETLTTPAAVVSSRVERPTDEAAPLEVTDTTTEGDARPTGPAPPIKEGTAGHEAPTTEQRSAPLPPLNEAAQGRKSSDARGSLKKDTRLLSQVTSALNSGDHHQALSLMQAADLKGSPLASEFAAARAVALCSLGRKSEGKAQVQTLLRNAPDSPALVRVKRVCDQ